MVLRGGILELPGDWVLQSTAGLWLERTFGCVFATPSFQHFFHLIAQRTRKDRKSTGRKGERATGRKGDSANTHDRAKWANNEHEELTTMGEG